MLRKGEKSIFPRFLPLKSLSEWKFILLRNQRNEREQSRKSEVSVDTLSEKHESLNRDGIHIGRLKE